MMDGFDEVGSVYLKIFPQGKRELKKTKKFSSLFIIYFFGAKTFSELCFQNKTPFNFSHHNPFFL